MDAPTHRPPLPTRPPENDPPLPQRPSESNAAKHRLDGTYQHSEKISVIQSSNSPLPEKKPQPNRNSNVPMARQLSAQELARPVPIANIGGGSPPSVRQDPIGKESGEDYIEPEPNPKPPSGDNDKHKNTKLKSIASISEEKKADIINEYYRGDSSLNLKVSVPKTLSEDSEPCHDYTNMMDLPDVRSPGASSPAIVSPGAIETSFKNSSHPIVTGSNSLGKAFGDLPDHPRSPRRPRPVPRQQAGGSGHSSRKHSLSNSESGKLSLMKVL